MFYLIIPILIFCTISNQNLFVSSSIDSTFASSGVIRLSPNNAADVYLVSEFIAVFYSYHIKSTPNATIDENIPIGLLAKQIYVQEFNGYVYIWNVKLAKLIMILRQDKIQKYSKDIELSLNMNHLRLDNIFNELVGINFVFFSSSCKDMFGYFGNLLAETIGIGCPPTGLINLNALFVYELDFPPGSCTISPDGPLHELAKINKPGQLIMNIARQSILLDAAAYWSQQYILQDSLFPIKTKSGYSCGNLIGDKQCIVDTKDAVGDLLTHITTDDTLKLAIDLFTAAAVDGLPGKSIVVVFEKNLEDDDAEAGGADDQQDYNNNNNNQIIGPAKAVPPSSASSTSLSTSSSDDGNENVQ